MRPVALVLLFALPAAALVPVPPIGHAPCGPAVAVTNALAWDSQLENLAFDDAGHLVVAGLQGDVLILLDGDEAVIDTLDLPGSHGIVYRPEDGRFYAAGALSGDGLDVVRFTVGDAGFSPVEVYASGLRTVNGMAFGPDGALYVTDPLATSPPYLVRIEPGGASWAPWKDTYGPNGIWPADGGLYAAITGDQSSPILHFPFGDGPPRQVAATTFGAVTLGPGLHSPQGDPVLIPKGLDDLTMGPDGMLYAVGHVTGDLLRIDPATGVTCTYASGFHEPTSVRFAPASFGGHAGALYVTDMGGIAVTALALPSAGSLWRIDSA